MKFSALFTLAFREVPSNYNDYATDTRLQSATNVGSETTLMVGKKSGQVKKRTIIKFDLQYSSIPSNATVLNAQLQLYYFNATVAGGSAWVDRWVQAHELLKSWHELQADSSERLDDIPWLAPRAKIGPGNNPITVDANGQFESTLLFQQGEYPTWKSWDLTNLTQKWVTTPSSNNGVILWATNEDVNSYDLRFYSSENETNQPQLMIIWSNQPKTVYFLKDHLGSIRATVLDSAGAPVVAYDDYDPWGYILSGRTKKRTWSDSQAVAKNKFTGKEWDDEFGMNWYFFPVRPYDPEIGRFLSIDPHAFSYPALTPYNYAGNNPLAFIDPTGTDSVSAQQQKKESLLDKLTNFLKSIFGSAVPDPNNPPTHVDIIGIVKKAAKASGGEEAAETATTVAQSSEIGNVPTPDPNEVVLQNLLENSTSRAKTKSDLQQRDREGDFNTANNDFDQLQGVSERNHGNGVRPKKLADGRRVIVRPTGREGKPTLEFQRSDGKPQMKYRYSRH